MHWRRDLEALRRERDRASPRTRLRAFLVPTYSYLSVIELGTYELDGARRRRCSSGAGSSRGADGFDAAVRGGDGALARPRLYPGGARRSATCCFYPMSKRRGEQVNWYDLPAEERAALHARPRRDRPQVRRPGRCRSSRARSASTTGSGASRSSPTTRSSSRSSIYEMRFDPASSRYALFGPFYVGIRFAPSSLSARRWGKARTRTMGLATTRRRA